MKLLICMAIISAVCALGASGDALAKPKAKPKSHGDALLLGAPLSHKELSQSRSNAGKAHRFDYVNDIPAENSQRPQNQDPPVQDHVQPPPPSWLAAVLVAAERGGGPQAGR